uniref:hypothetical protein n=1 Tax=Amycolatopsis sp. CA-290885 TaxID=3239925 RepID=UPI003F49342B
MELHELGRNAEDLAVLTDIPVKKVRAMIKSAKRAAPSVSQAEAPPAADAVTPSAAPVAASDTTAAS